MPLTSLRLVLRYCLAAAGPYSSRSLVGWKPEAGCPFKTVRPALSPGRRGPGPRARVMACAGFPAPSLAHPWVPTHHGSPVWRAEPYELSDRSDHPDWTERKGRSDTTQHNPAISPEMICYAQNQLRIGVSKRLKSLAQFALRKGQGGISKTCYPNAIPPQLRRNYAKYLLFLE
jgi:hypothetical protein